MKKKLDKHYSKEDLDAMLGFCRNVYLEAAPLVPIPVKHQIQVAIAKIDEILAAEIIVQDAPTKKGAVSYH